MRVLGPVLLAEQSTWGQTGPSVAAGDRPHEGGATFRFQQRRISEIIGFREHLLSEAIGAAVIEVDAIEFIPGNGGGVGVRLRKV
jgi:hypothetical protein